MSYARLTFTGIVVTTSLCARVSGAEHFLSRPVSGWIRILLSQLLDLGSHDYRRWGQDS